jgi:hypothetical protein
MGTERADQRLRRKPKDYLGASELKYKQNIVLVCRPTGGLDDIREPPIVISMQKKRAAGRGRVRFWHEASEAKALNHCQLSGSCGNTGTDGLGHPRRE